MIHAGQSPPLDDPSKSDDMEDTDVVIEKEEKVWK
jgi:hypothetical protein